MCNVNFTLLTFFRIVNKKILSLGPRIKAAAILIKGKDIEEKVKEKLHLFSTAGYLFVLFSKMKMNLHNVSQVDNLLPIKFRGDSFIF